MSDPVQHPRHYTAHPSGVECIDVAETMGFCLGNALKYIWRADLKGDALTDLRKARWYLDREIARREREGSAPCSNPEVPELVAHFGGWSDMQPEGGVSPDMIARTVEAPPECRGPDADITLPLAPEQGPIAPWRPYWFPLASTGPC